MIRLGVIGAGVMGGNHARVASNLSDFHLVGIVDPRKDACEQLASKYGCNSYSGPEEILNEVDAIVIASPTSTHAELIEFFSMNQRHVLVEKPVCEQVEQLDNFVTSTQIMVGHVERFNPAVRFAKPSMSTTS